ncbi:phage holin family protein [Euzebya tangerina]|uniref:phage holin family protein n=1 Tax=Euzebya tangerina TaxID=591198 RepID=UPI000E3197B3|nr:phage holin family protein [Euzebya tangerina]
MRWILVKVAINAAALWAAAALVTGIELTSEFWGVVGVAVWFGLVNAIIRPVARFLSFPFLIVTLGLFTLVINAAMLLLTDWLSVGLQVSGFTTALLGALVVSLVSWVLSVFLPEKDRD